MADAALAKAALANATALGLETASRLDLVPVLPALRPVVPGLRPGSIVGVAGAGAASLGLALVAGVSRHGGESGTGGWCAVVGMPEFGVAAAVGMGAAPERLLLVDEPDGRWPDVVAALIEAVDLVLVRPPERPGTAAVRRLTALARKHGCVLTVTGHDWPGTAVRLRIDQAEWIGLGDGHGRLRGRRARIVAEGRGAPGAGRRTWVWLPGPDGEVAPYEPAVPADLRPVEPPEGERRTVGRRTAGPHPVGPPTAAPPPATPHLIGPQTAGPRSVDQEAVERRAAGSLAVDQQTTGARSAESRPALEVVREPPGEDVA
ncbi:hypothetical protein ACGFNU_16515 [Spirillospora sp. NPDC048911]|uniref:hypothetical protein n=1 Tax=Spirillospora sp. NPDC048911 TaxID=3364527 RepID=UPI00371BA135